MNISVLGKVSNNRCKRRFYIKENHCIIKSWLWNLYHPNYFFSLIWYLVTTPKGNQHIWIVSGQVLIISSVLMILVRGPSCSSSSVCLFLDMVWSVYLWPVFLSCFADRFLNFCNCFLHVFSFPFFVIIFCFRIILFTCYMYFFN